jgi:cytochrome c oxidase subunit 3
MRLKVGAEPQTFCRLPEILRYSHAIHSMTRPHQERNYSIHPSSIMLVLILLGVSALFGALSFAYLYTRVDKGMDSIRIPLLFVFNTLVLAASSVGIQFCRKAYRERNEKACLRWGLNTLLTTLLFLTLQGIAWHQLLTQQLLPGTSGGHGYLYAISILHFLHVFAGLPFLFRIIWPLMIAIRQGNASLFFIDEHQERRLKHTAWYWHFIDLVWVYLILFLFINTLL